MEAHTVTVNTPRSTIVMILTLQVKIVRKVALMRIGEDPHIEREVTSIIKTIQVCFSSFTVPPFLSIC